MINVCVFLCGVFACMCVNATCYVCVCMCKLCLCERCVYMTKCMYVYVFECESTFARYACM